MGSLRTLNITTYFRISRFFVVFVCGHFVQWNECRLLLFLLKKTLSMEWMFFFCSFMQILYHCTSTDFFRFYKYPMRQKVYSHVYLIIRFIELACYGSRNNVLEQITWIWNWRKFRLNLHYMILTSAALNLWVLCYVFAFSFYVFFPCRNWLFVIFVLKLAVSWLDTFYSVQATKQPFQIVF